MIDRRVKLLLKALEDGRWHERIPAQAVTARVIEGVTIGPSPDWMVKRLEAVGMRSVNNVVDATNYAMMEMGQPPHAFDYAKIAEGKIIVRKAIAGERIVSIDGSRCELDGDMLVIADGKGRVWFADAYNAQARGPRRSTSSSFTGSRPISTTARARAWPWR